LVIRHVSVVHLAGGVNVDVKRVDMLTVKAGT
jgi:hypothetical protein